ncbi:unnamed protein product [Periconia digitata]|uniref:Uncharacterized protein n=1 Tax=Periconia digitata TaxID=1303443 RepID=A0A9W4ULU1_9PLEO|nr:unnamed protein product [Periconia digitata]
MTIPLFQQQFLSSIRAFLSLLATTEAKDLDYIQSKLLPHRLPLPAPSCETTQATPSQFLSSSDASETSQQSDVRLTTGSRQPLPVGSAPHLTTAK